MKQEFMTMLELQDRMNFKVHPDWINQQFAWFRALWIECGELIEHYGYKWWKKQAPDMEQVKLEVVDIWHFGLSMLFDGERGIEQIADCMCADLEVNPIKQLSVLEATEQLACFTLVEKKFSVSRFWALLSAAGMTPEELYCAYVGKNVLNFFRQDNGYKEGTYIKVWDGREDNEHLVELIGKLDRTSASFSKDLYQALDNRYQQFRGH